MTEERLEKPIDGRNARRVRSREAMLDATLDLIYGGDPEPTAQRVAERAGVSLRLVYEQFRDMEGLVMAVASRQVTRIAPLMMPVAPEGALEERVLRFVGQRAQLYEHISPLRKTLRLRASSKEQVAFLLRGMRELKREQAWATFATEIGAFEGEARELAKARVAAVTAFAMWESLRDDQGLSIEAAQRVMVGLVKGSLATCVR